jgi:hypothetical protein
VPAQHRVLVPEHQQFSLLGQLLAEHQDGQGGYKANHQADDLDRHPASQPSPPPGRRRNIFVGALCALGVFLGAYDGYDDWDRWITNIAGLGALGVAFCPTKPAVCAAGARACPASSVTHLSASQQAAGDIHVFFAAATFVMLGLMALRFAKGGKAPPGQDTMGQIRYGLGFGKPNAGDQPQRYRGENFIYRASGITILSCVILAALSNLLPAPVSAHWPLLFIFEAAAVFFFGFSWFVKGRTIEGIRNRIPSAGAPAARPRSGRPVTERSPVAEPCSYSAPP